MRSFNLRRNKVLVDSEYTIKLSQLAQQQGFDWFRVEKEKSQLAQQQGFDWFNAQSGNSF